jgi:hypothetical protein
MHLEKIGVAEVAVFEYGQAVAAGDRSSRSVMQISVQGSGAGAEDVADLFAFLDAVDLVEGVIEDEEPGPGGDGAGDHRRQAWTREQGRPLG